MKIDVKQVKELRERTGCGVMECKEALQEASGDMERAVEILRRKGSATAVKKAKRVTKDGLIGSYIHFGGKLGVLIEVNCETDFVANTQEFKDLVKDLAMQVASANPFYISKEDVPGEVIKKEEEIYRAQAIAQGRPEKVVDRIVEGKMNKFYSQVCLLEQPFIKDDDITVREYINRAVAKLGENITVKRFIRYQLGEST